MIFFLLLEIGMMGVFLAQDLFLFYIFWEFTLVPMYEEGTRAWAPVVIGLSVIGILYGAFVALVQPDMKKLIAYSSVSHLGFVMLGIFAFDHAAVSGSVLQMVNHGLSTGALFLLVGVIYERLHTREIARFGGLAKVMPMYAAILLLVSLSSIGLPGTNGFVGEFLILLGTFREWPIAAAAGGLGVILGAVYMLWLYQRVALGPLTREENRHVTDASKLEVAYLAPLVAGILFLGLYPKPVLDRIDPAVQYTLEHVERKALATAGERNARPVAENAR